MTIPKEQRFKGCVVIGRPGSGKSTLLLNGVRMDAEGGYTVICADPGDLGPDVMDTVSESALTRARFFSVNHPLYVNFAGRAPDTGRRVNEFIGWLNAITAQSSTSQEFTARMKRPISHIFSALTDPSLLAVVQYLREHRKTIAASMGMDDRTFGMTYDGLMDRLFQVMADVRLRRLFFPGPWEELRFGSLLDTEMILPIWVGNQERPIQRAVGTTSFSMLGATLLERPPEQRKECVLVQDEFPVFLASSHSTDLAQQLFREGRKYKVAMTVAIQDFGNVDKGLVQTFMGNAGSVICFSCGEAEARMMSGLCGGKFSPQHIMLQEDYHAVARIGTEVVEFEALPPPKKLRNLGLASEIYTGPEPPDPFTTEQKRVVTIPPEEEEDDPTIYNPKRSKKK